MLDKSFVTLEQRVCEVCGQPYGTGDLLMDRRMRNRFDHHTVTGWGMCEEHQKMYDDGMIALVEIDPDKTGVSSGAKMVRREDAYRTGTITFVKPHLFEQLFNMSATNPKTGRMWPMTWIEPAVTQYLARIAVEPAND